MTKTTTYRVTALERRVAALEGAITDLARAVLALSGKAGIVPPEGIHALAFPPAVPVKKKAPKTIRGPGPGRKHSVPNNISLPAKADHSV